MAIATTKRPPRTFPRVVSELQHAAAPAASDAAVATLSGLAASAKPYAHQVGGAHYTSKAVQPWTAMEVWMTPEQFAGFLRGNAIKYLARCDDKGGLDDIKKARHYLDKLIQVREGLEAGAAG